MIIIYNAQCNGSILCPVHTANPEERARVLFRVAGLFNPLNSVVAERFALPLNVGLSVKYLGLLVSAKGA